MADISNEIAVIATATYGEQVRTAICNALSKMNADGTFGDGLIIAGDVVGFRHGCVVPTITGIVSQESEE